MNCTKAQKLISVYVASEESWLCPEERRALEAHLAVCGPCRRDCRESLEAIRVFRDCWTLSADTAALLEKGRSSDRQGNFASTIRLFRYAAVRAVAACLVLGLLGAGASFHRRTSLPGPDRMAAQAGADLPVTIELADGSQVAPGAILQTLNRQMQRLILNGRHQVVMNGGTRLSVTSLVTAGRAGCRIDLAGGEVYVQVEHDGNPFVVQTVHGRAVITGTTFDVKATGAGTTLTVAEGSVRFESAAGAVQVAAGQRSTIAAAASGLPGSPALCDAAALTAWARPGGTVPEIVQVAVQNTAVDVPTLGSLSPIPSASPRVQVDLDGIDYGRWIEQNRGWFRRQFPWIFDLGNALARQGIEVDYPELLLRCGDLWRFGYGEERPERFSWLDPNTLVAVSRDYGFDLQWLSQHVPSVGHARERHNSMVTDPAGLEGLERWLEESCSAADRMPTGSWHSYHAAQYVAQTRTLVWLAVRDGRCAVPPAHRTEVMELLRKVILAAQEWEYEELCVPETRDSADCDNPTLKRDPARAALARTIRACEKTLAEYVRAGVLTACRHSTGDRT